MISKLKVQVGTQFTSKMEGMLNDLSTALEHEKAFKEFRENDSEKSRKVLDTAVQVLTTGNWPTYQCPEISLPNQMQLAVDQFMRFYNAEGTTRRVKWFYR
jgi:cullin 1